MILAKNNTARDYLGIHPNLDLALERINGAFFAQLGSERVDIIPGEVWCTKFTYETITDDESFFEAHEKFLDIHLMLEGSERVEVAPPAALEQAYLASYSILPVFSSRSFSAFSRPSLISV